MSLRILYFLSFFLTFSGFSQAIKNYITSTVEVKYIVSEAINHLVDFQFEKSDSEITLLKKKYPEHPLGYFLKGYSFYWQLQVNEESTLYDSSILIYMDSSIAKAEKLYAADKRNFEAIFFLCASYAFKARLLSDRQQWAASFWSGKHALSFLEKGKEEPNELSFEFMFGDALYNYYAEWIPENYKAFKPFMWFFPKGSKEKGLELLRKTSQNAYFARTEAQYFLTRILLYEEKNFSEAIPICNYLMQTYPNNPVFERLFIRLMFSSGNYPACEKKSMEILSKIDSMKVGYEAVSGRFASFFVGWIYMNRDKQKAKEYFLRSIRYCEQVGATKMNYYFYALSALAKFAHEEGNTTEALGYYSKIKSNAEKKHELYKEAKKYIREND